MRFGQKGGVLGETVPGYKIQELRQVQGYRANIGKSAERSIASYWYFANAWILFTNDMAI